uniref:Uncharacterized protein n=1 Tax=Microcystis aeruginosa (strain PCC 7806) TaxID=267872 RepID=A8YE67_MICA7|nr:unnamed protein product [Microcystis aeruginosa PCC 7806]
MGLVNRCVSCFRYVSCLWCNWLHFSCQFSTMASLGWGWGCGCDLCCGCDLGCDWGWGCGCGCGWGLGCGCGCGWGCGCGCGWGWGWGLGCALGWGCGCGLGCGWGCGWGWGCGCGWVMVQSPGKYKSVCICTFLVFCFSWIDRWYYFQSYVRECSWGSSNWNREHGNSIYSGLYCNRVRKEKL